jgi:hypothetical protein
MNRAEAHAMIENPSQGGYQGYCPTYWDTPYHNILKAAGYEYSHSTPTGRADGTFYIHHTYRKAGHYVGVSRDEFGRCRWETSTGKASGRSWTGTYTTALAMHLKNKARRYKELR